MRIMDMVEYLSRLLAYDAWANHEVLTALSATPMPPPRALQFMAHILAAQRLWMERLKQQDQTLPVWPEFTIEGCETQARELTLLWKDYLAGSSELDLANSVSYRNSKGEVWSSRKDDVLMHLVMHSAYHRGQIATGMRSAGLTPAYTDFIRCIRQGFIE